MDDAARMVGPWLSALPLILFVALPLISFIAAHVAGQGRGGSWAWGLFGPFGWIVAAILGASTKNVEAIEVLRRQLRRYDARESNESQTG